MDLKQCMSYIEDVNIDLEKLSNQVEEFLDKKEEYGENEEKVTQFMLHLKTTFEAQARLAALLIPADVLKAQEKEYNDHTASYQPEQVNWDDLTPQQRLKQKVKDKVAKYGGIPALGAGIALPKASPSHATKLNATGTSAAVEIFSSKVGAEPEFVQKLAQRRQNEDVKKEPSEMEKLRTNLKKVEKPKNFEQEERVTAADVNLDKDSALGNELAAVLARKRNEESG
eukprot:TRINITY_DN21934_c0_g1_i3.p1 TRINITY_DN21934_c0_g1~~TRINITY_DN21934_c0_g1_i3.p1  ORF type:complete len:240 (-),score=49.95 TRINITY_DN21934_c0_g1_i3:446-1126(-)